VIVRFAHAVVAVYVPNFGRFSRNEATNQPERQSQQTNSRWIGSHPISIKTPNNTRENIEGNSHLHTTKRRSGCSSLSISLFLFVSRSLLRHCIYDGIRAIYTKIIDTTAENRANNSSFFPRSIARRNLIRIHESSTQWSPKEHISITMVACVAQ